MLLCHKRVNCASLFNRRNEKYLLLSVESVTLTFIFLFFSFQVLLENMKVKRKRKILSRLKSRPQNLLFPPEQSVKVINKKVNRRLLISDRIFEVAVKILFADDNNENANTCYW